MAADGDKGDVFVSTLERGYKTHYDALCREEERDTPSPFMLQVAAMQQDTFVSNFERIKQRDQCIIIGNNGFELAGFAQGAGIDWSGSYHWNGSAWVKQVDPPKACGPVCECGVKFTGGLHSDWCPLHG